jgi:hypothetical protein
MHPGSKDYTQRVIAWSILLDGSVCELVEEFLSVLRLSQFERGRRLVEPRSRANKFVKTGGRAEDKTNNQQPRARAEPAIKQPADDQPTNYRSEERHGRAVGDARLNISVVLIVVRCA